MLNAGCRLRDEKWHNCFSTSISRSHARNSDHLGPDCYRNRAQRHRQLASLTKVLLSISGNKTHFTPITSVWRKSCHVMNDRLHFQVRLAVKRYDHRQSIRLNTLGPRQNRCHIADDTFKLIFLYENGFIWFRFHWNMFLRFQLTIIHHWFR